MSASSFALDFSSTRQDGQTDLVAEITRLMKEANHPNPEAWLNDLTVEEAAPAAPKLQQFLINRYWRLQLGACKASTTAERYCLVDQGTPEEYLKIFKTALIPAIIRCGLPAH